MTSQLSLSLTRTINSRARPFPGIPRLTHQQVRLKGRLPKTSEALTTTPTVFVLYEEQPDTTLIVLYFRACYFTFLVCIVN
jgi:hypothetical protein